MDCAPIGIFDSGIGGLTVLRAIRRTLSKERVIYLADRAHLPYGSKSKEEILEAAFFCSSFLMKQSVKCIVIACHTASIYALDALQKELPIPVFGLVQPSIDQLSRLPRPRKLAILGTKQTIQSKIYETAAAALWPHLSFQSLACPEFVSLVEKRLTYQNSLEPPLDPLKCFGRHTEEAKELIHSHLSVLQSDPPDSALLACTHFPFLRSLIREELGPSCLLLDPAERAAFHLRNYLFQHHLESSAPQGDTQFCESLLEGVCKVRFC